MREESLAATSDGEVVARLVELLREERRLTAAVLAHLGEVEARRLYRPAACSSMHIYCVRVLGMSEDQAFKRIRAARAMREFPVGGADAIGEAGGVFDAAAVAEEWRGAPGHRRGPHARLGRSPSRLRARVTALG